MVVRVKQRRHPVIGGRNGSVGLHGHARIDRPIVRHVAAKARPGDDWLLLHRIPGSRLLARDAIRIGEMADGNQQR